MNLQVGVKVIIKNDKAQYLFLHRSTKLSTDSDVESWDIPGGRINPDESLQVALKREVKEEIGHVIQNIPKLLVAQDIFVQAKNIHVVRLTYLIKENVTEIHLSDEHDKYQWVGEAEITSVNAEPYLAEVLNDL